MIPVPSANTTKPMAASRRGPRAGSGDPAQAVRLTRDDLLYVLVGQAAPGIEERFARLAGHVRPRMTAGLRGTQRGRDVFFQIHGPDATHHRRRRVREVRLLVPRLDGPEPQDVAVPQDLRARDADTVDEGAVLRAKVAHRGLITRRRQHGVRQADVRVVNAQIAVRAAPEHLASGRQHKGGAAQIGRARDRKPGQGI